VKYRSMTMDIDGLHVELTGEGQLIIVSQRTSESIALVPEEWQSIIAAMMMRNWIGPCELGRVESDTKIADYDNHPLATPAEF
jgi:hypothetical protein